jgi:hypothetical protein
MHGVLRHRDPTRLSRYVRRLFQALSNLKQAVDLPSGSLEFMNLTLGEDYIVGMVAVVTDFNMSSQKEYMRIADDAAPVINQLFTYSYEA